MDKNDNKKEEKNKLIGWFNLSKQFILKYPKQIGIGAASTLVLILLLSLSGGNPTSSSSSSQGTGSSSATSSSSSSESLPAEVTVTFDSQGGTFIQSITGTPGASITADLTTTKFGFDFQKFSTSAEGEDTLNLTIFPNQSLTAFAIWEAQLFSVTFNEMTGDIINYDTGAFSTLYITENGEFFGLGRNTNGVFGNGQKSSTIISVPVNLTEFLPLQQGEKPIQVRVGGIFGGGTLSLLLTNQHRLLAAGSNATLAVGQSELTEHLTYQDITPTLGLNQGETILDILLGSDVQGVRTSTNRVILWGGNQQERIFPQPNEVPSFLPVGTPTDVTSTFTSAFNQGENIELISLVRQAGVVKTTANRYFVWGRNTNFALMMFQAQNTVSNTLINVTTQVLDVIGDDEEITAFVPHHDSFNMYFFTTDDQIYNYGDYRYLFLPNTTDRPTFQGSFFGDSTPFNMNSRFNLTEGEKPTHVFGFGFITNQNRYHHGSAFTGTYTLNTSDLSTLLQEGERVVKTFGIQTNATLVTDRGRVFVAGNSLTLSNQTMTYLSVVEIDILDLPYQSELTFEPERAGYTYVGWFTDRNLTSPFTGTIPANNDLVLYTRFISNAP